MYSAAAAALLLMGSALADPRNFTTIQPTGSFNPLAATAVQTVYPKDHHIIKGRYCDHIWTIVLDNADFDDANSNSDLQALAEKGLLLDNYYAVESNSQANYLAIVGGDTFGLTEERFVSLPENVSTIVESFEDAHVLWAQYAEDQPFTAYNGWTYGNYSRAKNGFAAFDSIMDKQSRFVNLRSLERLQYDISSHRFPQWVFIRPNVVNDGTDSDLDTAAAWVRSFVEEQLERASHRHLYHVVFARTSSSSGANRVWSLLLGDMHNKLRGTTDSTYYDHYSIIATAQANYDLPTLGRFDCSANVFSVVNAKAHISNERDPDVNGTADYNQGPFTGYLSDDSVDLPVPNLQCDRRNGIVGRVKKIWKKASYGYEDWLNSY